MGEGPLLVLHAFGESALDWRWMFPDLARTHRVYALDLPGFGDSGNLSADYSPAFFALRRRLPRRARSRAGRSGKQLARRTRCLRLALSEPERVSALALVDSACLGREVAYALRLPTLPGYGEGAVA